MKRLFAVIFLSIFISLIGAQEQKLNLNLDIGYLNISFDEKDADSPYPYIVIRFNSNWAEQWIIALKLHEGNSETPELFLNKHDKYFENTKDIAKFSNDLEGIIKSRKYKDLTLIDFDYEEYNFDLAMIDDSIRSVYKLLNLAVGEKLLTGPEKIKMDNDEIAPTGESELWVPGQREQGSHISQTSTMLYVPGKGLVPYSGDTVTIHKSEKGSSSETTLGGPQGKVGQNICQPVYSSLPLPQTVPASIYKAIPDLIVPPNVVIYSAQARQRAFLNYYELDGTGYKLKSKVPLEQREPLWQILEDAGFDPAKTDFREGRTLNPVVIGFTVTKDNQLRGAEVLQSSGDAQIDEAVLYGFKRCVFWNKTGETVPGKFTYRF
jgi:TonB family protein